MTWGLFTAFAYHYLFNIHLFSDYPLYDRHCTRRKASHVSYYTVINYISVII